MGYSPLRIRQGGVFLCYVLIFTSYYHIEWHHLLNGTCLMVRFNNLIYLCRKKTTASYVQSEA